MTRMASRVSQLNGEARWRIFARQGLERLGRSSFHLELGNRIFTLPRRSWMRCADAVAAGRDATAPRAAYRLCAKRLRSI